MRILKTFTFTAAVPLLLTLQLCGAAYAQNIADTFHANGALALLDGCDIEVSPMQCFNVEVSTDSTASQKTTHLRYVYFFLDLDTGVFHELFGTGTIPNNAFHGGGKAPSLSVDTSTVTGFINGVCDRDVVGVETCDFAAPGGLVTLAFTVMNSVETFHSSGMSKFSFVSGQVIRGTGTSDFNRGYGNLNILGLVQANVPGAFGTNHNTTITVTH